MKSSGLIGSLILLTLIWVTTVTAVEQQPSMAPEWDVSEWINGKGVSVADLKGSVVIVDFFQLWCPGCNSFSIPLMKRWHGLFADEIDSGRLVLISLHTVFEGHDYQNPARLRAFLKEKGISHLVGIDRHNKGEETPQTMKIYRTRGTPEMAFIDKQGRLRFKHFGSFNTDLAEQFVRQLLAESP